MKVGVITRHAIINYGSLLQAFATQTVIEKLGHDCEIIHYLRVEEDYKHHEKTLLNRKPGWCNSPIKKAIYLTLRQPESILSGKRFERFQRDLFNLSRRYKTKDELLLCKPYADIYMTGSDQVWGPIETGKYDDTYCLSFTDSLDKRIAFAASFGRTTFSAEVESYYKRWLKTYNAITVREDSAKEFVEGLGLSAKQVLDPTLILDSKFWDNYTKREPTFKYILVYQLHNDKSLNEYAKKVAKHKGMKLIRISTSIHQAFRGGHFVWCPDVGEFLTYIKYAECMITDSFHGTAFAINFNTPFIEVLPNNNTGTRNMSILRLTGLSNRLLSNVNDLELADQKIDFTHANKVLESERIRSLQIIKEMMNLVEE